MTQLELAEKLNVSRQAVSRWEMGTAKPEADTLIAICDLVDVSLDFLLRDKAQEKRGDPEELLPPVPKYWDHLPKLWFLPAVFAVLCRIFPYFTEVALMFHFSFWETLETFVLEHKLLLIFFSPPVAYCACGSLLEWNLV